MTDSRVRRAGRRFLRQFSHPYGPCGADGCDEAAERWTQLCDRHYVELIERVTRERAEADFNRRADIVAEGIRRAAASEPPDWWWKQSLNESDERYRERMERYAPDAAAWKARQEATMDERLRAAPDFDPGET